jgi:hypothetical protein
MAVGAAASGCYAYIPATVNTVAVGAEVRARLSLGAAERVAEVIAPGGDEVRRVMQGRLVEKGASSLVFLVSTGPGGAPGGPRLAQRLRFNGDDILEIETQHLARRRTALVAGGGAAVLAIVVARQLRDSGAGLGPNSGGDRPPELNRPAGFAIRLPFGLWR